MITQPLSPYAQGKIVGENWTPDEPLPVCPFEAGTQEALDFRQGVLDGGREKADEYEDEEVP